MRAAIAVAALCVLSSCTPAPEPFNPENAPKKILLVSIDTTRADRLSAYGFEKPTTPFLNRFAKKGTRFANAYAVMPTTDPSHTSILTGQYPRTHGIMRNAARRTDPDAPTLGTFLQERGYRTASITARLGLDPALRRIAGFDHTDAPRAPARWRTGPQIVRMAKAWLAENDDERWFLWVHLWEPHMPYKPARVFREKLTDVALEDVERFSDPPRFLRDGQTIPAEMMANSTALYDAELLAADAALNRIVRAAYESGPVDEPPLVMIVSDHGESMAEREDTRRIGFGHGVLLYNETVHVPWVAVWEGRIARRVVDTHLSLVDLAPTVMDLVDPGKAYRTEGRSVVEAVLGTGTPEPVPFYLERRVFSSGARPDLKQPETSLVDYPYKLLENRFSNAPELYRLDRDPGETHNLFVSEVELAESMVDALGAWQAAHPIPGQLGEKTRAAEQEREALRALGYLD